MEEPKKTASEREITYHVGWKRGKIQLPTSADGSNPGDHDVRPWAEVIKTVRVSPLLALVWRPVPTMPAGVLMGLLFALPAAGFAATLWVVNLLTR